jgi:hypothetical protein
MILKDDLSNLKEILRDFDTRMDNWENDLFLGGKNLERAIMGQPSYYAYYDQIKAELECLYNHVDLMANIAQAKSMRVISQNPRLIGERNTEKMSKDDPEYKRYALARAEFEERLTKAKSIVQSFEQRGYSLNNIVKLKIALLGDITIII